MQEETKDKKKVLFISHDASRSGAPIVLLNFLRWFKDNSDIPFLIVLKNGGKLENDFSQLAPTFNYQHFNDLKIKSEQEKFQEENRVVHRILRKLGLPSPVVHKILHPFKTDESNREELKFVDMFADHDIGLIYSNTITNGYLLDELSALNCPVITHVHELEYVIQSYGLDEFSRCKSFTNHYIACAEVVKENLVNSHGIKSDDITVVHEFIPMIDLSKITRKLRQELDLPEDAFIVGSSGWVQWRKGYDLFIQLAYRLLNKAPDIPAYFVWVGRMTEEQELQIKYDLDKSDLKNRVYFVGEKSDPLDYYADFDVFVLTSREDPYPLVCLENALLGVPVVCVDQSGGGPEFVEEDCGFVVPYLDLDAMVDKIIYLYRNSKIRLMLGENAKKKVRRRYDIDIAALKIVDIIKNYC